MQCATIVKQSKFTRAFSVMLVVLTMIALIISCAMPSEALAIPTFRQYGYALRPYSVSDYQTIHNKKYAQQNSTNYVWCSYSNHKLKYTRGNLKASFSTRAFLAPYSFGSYYNNPQSIVVTPQARYIYVAYQKGNSKSYSNPPKGRIVRYDNWGIIGLKARALAHKNPESYLRKHIRAYMKIGPWFTMGHGQNLALNPKTYELWMSTRPCQSKTNLTRINRNTLRPNRIIKFKVRNGVKMGANLCFGSTGRFYFWTTARSGWGSRCPSGTAKVYQGRINKKRTKVTIKLVMRGIKNPASKSNQGIAYNATKHCLYLVGDSAITRINLTKLLAGTITKRDIKVEIFHPIREFEGLTFTARGSAYLLVNKINEVMKSSKL